MPILPVAVVAVVVYKVAHKAYVRHTLRKSFEKTSKHYDSKVVNFEDYKRA
jgi:hypothetical protein